MAARAAKANSKKLKMNSLGSGCSLMRRRFHRSPFCEWLSSYGNMSEVLALLQLLFHQGTADTGVAVSVHPVGEPSARNADLSGVAPLHHAVVSVTPFLHRQHRFPVSTDVLAEERCEAVGRLSVIPGVLFRSQSGQSI